MEATPHANGHSQTKRATHVLSSSKIAKSSSKMAKKSLRKARLLGARATSAALTGERKLEGKMKTMARGVTAWVKANPKTAIGAGVGVAVTIGLLTRPRFTRAVLMGLGGVAVAAMRRFF